MWKSRVNIEKGESKIKEKWKKQEKCVKQRNKKEKTEFFLEKSKKVWKKQNWSERSEKNKEDNL